MKNVLLHLMTILLIVVRLSVILSLVEAIQSETTKGIAEEGTPIQFMKEKPCFNLEITDYASENDTLYVLFDANHELRCYSPKEGYLHSFRYRGYKGGAQLYSDESHVYLADRGRYIYVFENGECIEYIDWDKNKQRVEDLEELLWNGKESVELKDGSLVFTQKTSLLIKSPTGTETIIYRHPLTALFYHKTLICIAIASFLLYAILRAIGKDVADEGTVCVSPLKK